MTIRNHVDLRGLNASWSDFERCAEEAPAGTYAQAKAIAEMIESHANALIKELHALGMKADTCDGVREVEALMYGYIRDSNPDAPIFPTAEGFGQAMEGPARERVLAQAASNAAFFQQRNS